MPEPTEQYPEAATGFDGDGAETPSVEEWLTALEEKMDQVMQMARQFLDTAVPKQVSGQYACEDCGVKGVDGNEAPLARPCLIKNQPMMLCASCFAERTKGGEGVWDVGS